jgi:hypothetical protein
MSRKYEDEPEGIQDDSSRLSTDFYEEYFRLLNSIKKEQSKNNTSDPLLKGADTGEANSHNLTLLNKTGKQF